MLHPLIPITDADAPVARPEVRIVAYRPDRRLTLLRCRWLGVRFIYRSVDRSRDRLARCKDRLVRRIGLGAPAIRHDRRDRATCTSRWTGQLGSCRRRNQHQSEDNGEMFHSVLQSTRYCQTQDVNADISWILIGSILTVHRSSRLS